MKQTEAQLHSQVCQYLKIQYPKIIFNTDMAGIKLTIGQATKAKQLRSGNGFPDIVIYEPKANYHCLFIELKSEGAKVFKKNGESATPHIQEQKDMIAKLNKKGYAAAMCIGFIKAKKVIDYYLNL